MKASGVITHVTGGLIFLSLPLLFLSGGNRSIIPLLVSPFFWLFFFFYAVLFYINTYVLIPQLYFKKKTFIYISILLLLFCVVLFLQPFDMLMSHGMQPGAGNRPPPPPDGMMPRNPPGGPPGPQHASPHIDIVSIFLFVMVLALSLAVQNTLRWRTTAQRAAKAETDKAQAELSFLKAQINPHFLFNTLNNIYSLAVTKSDHTAESIMKLSNIMRYVSDDVTEDVVPLQSEADCIINYVDLQRLRLGKKTGVELTISGNLDNKKIAPLVLMTFVENAFKYGVSNHAPSDIVITLMSDEHSIQFNCRNKITAASRPPERTGIGIANTRQRLEHQYSQQHTLTITNADGFFNVALTLAV